MVHAAASNAGAGRLSEERLNRAFAALADPTRRAAVELLRRGPRRAGELAEQLGSSPAGLSRHLRVLRESGLVGEQELEEDGRVRLLDLEREPFDALRCWVEDVETFWTGQLAYSRRTPNAGAESEVGGERQRRGCSGCQRPPRRLALEWRGVNRKPHEKTLVEVTFTPSGEGTMVRVEHRGWSALPGDHPARHGLAGADFARMIGVWWGDLLSSLREHVAMRKS